MHGKLSSPIQWFGGKGLLASKIIQFFPLHEVYVEPFGGGASCLLAKPPSQIEVYNDLDSGLVNFWRVVRDPEKFEQLYRKIALTPYSRQEFSDCLATWEGTEDVIERAFRWFIVARMSFSGAFGTGANSWSHWVGMSRRSMAGAVSRYLSAIDWLPEVHKRLMRVQIEHQDFRTILKRYNSPVTLFYLDPPYVHGTRGAQRYDVELQDKDHEEMVDVCRQLKGKIVLSGYPNPLYQERLEDEGKWYRHDFTTSCYAAGRTKASGLQGEFSATDNQARTESLWISPSARAQRAFEFDD